MYRVRCETWRMKRPLFHPWRKVRQYVPDSCYFWNDQGELQGIKPLGYLSTTIKRLVTPRSLQDLSFTGYKYVKDPDDARRVYLDPPSDKGCWGEFFLEEYTSQHGWRTLGRLIGNEPLNDYEPFPDPDIRPIRR